MIRCSTVAGKLKICKMPNLLKKKESDEKTPQKTPPPPPKKNPSKPTNQPKNTPKTKTTQKTPTKSQLCESLYLNNAYIRKISRVKISRVIFICMFNIIMRVYLYFTFGWPLAMFFPLSPLTASC